MCFVEACNRKGTGTLVRLWKVCFFFLTQNIALVVCSGLCVKFCEMWVKVICFGAGRLLLSSVVAGVFC